jgi:tartrate-resistant acid phosphatase type 5
MRLFPAALLATLLLAFPASAQELRIAFVGDTGTGDSKQRAVRDQMLKANPSYVFMLGDNIYSSGSRRYFGPRYDEIYAPLMTKGVVFHSALGNHDVEGCDATPLNPLPADAKAYVAEAFRCNAEAHLTHGPFGYVGNRRYYAVSIPAVNPLVDVFVLDTNTLKTSQSKLLLREDTAQLQWLDGALGRSRARWKVAIMHHPPHSPTTGAKNFFFVPIGGGRTREYQLDLQITPILRKHRVDAVFTGHNHFYARMLPQEGIRYFVSGGGGRKTYGFKEESGYVAAGGDWYHFVLVTVTRNAFTYRAIDEDGEVRDAGWWAKGDAADRTLAAPGAAAGS